MSTTSGSRAALSIVVVPVGEHGGGDDVLRRPDAREREGDVGAVQAIGRGVQLAVGELERGAHRLQPGDVHVDRAGAEVVAAGHRQAHLAAARQQRAEHVDRGADALDELVGGDRDEVAVVARGPAVPAPGCCVRTPRAASSSPMIATSSIAGTLVSSYSPSASRLAAISLSTAFFAPGTRIVPSSGPRWRIVIWSARSRLAPMPAPERQRRSGQVQPAWPGNARLQSQTRQYAPAVKGREHGSRVTRSWPAGGATAEHVLSPRDDIVRERADGDGRFVQEAGPFLDYERIVEPRRRRHDDRGTDHLSVPHCRGSGGSLALPIRWAIARRGHDPTSDRPLTHRTPAWAPPDRLTPRQLSVLGLLAASSMASAFINTLFTQTVEFAADDFGVGDSGIGIAGAVVRAGIVFVLPARRPRRPHRPADRDRRRRLRRSRSSPPPGRSRRRSRSSSPRRRSDGRSVSPSTSSSPSSPPRRCRATRGPTPSASWRWPAGSVPASPWSRCPSPTSAPAAGASCTS